ncbi:MAG: glycosyltransferase family 39 protein [Spartobacteria bacterium]|nr:glycosyltransferase family 39 protein [Spartobacteria bacterium]
MKNTASTPCFAGKKAAFDRFAQRFGIWAIILVAVLLLIPGTSTIPLIDRDEPRFAEATREMSQTGEWFVPYFNGNYRFDKPILTYWVMTPGLMLSEKVSWISTEMGTRLHSMIAALLVALATYFAGRHWFSPGVGFLAGFGMITCLQIQLHGRSDVADMPMVLCVILAMTAFYEMLMNPGAGSQKRWFWLGYLALGIGFLAKGPVVWLIPLLSCIMYRWIFYRKKLPWKKLHLLYGIPIVLLIIGLWGIPALIKTHGLFWDRGMGEHVFDRGFKTMAGGGHLIFYYLMAAFVSLFPWIAYGGYSWKALRKNWSPINAWLVSWLVSTYLFFSFYHTQLPHYVMPSFAAFFMIFGQIIMLSSSECRPWCRRFYRTVICFPAVLGSLVLLFCLIYPFAYPYNALRPFFASAGCALIGLSIFGTCLHSGRRVRLVAGLLITIMSLVVFGRSFRSVSVPIKLLPSFAAMPENATYLSTGFNEPSLVFYSGERWQRFGDYPSLEKAMQSNDGPQLVAVLEKEYSLESFFQRFANEHWGKRIKLRQKDFSSDNTALPTEGYTTQLIEGINPARTSWAIVRTYTRTTP